MPRLRVVQINVDDMDRAVEFYGRLGFEVASRDHYPQIVKLAHEDDERISLLLYRVDRPARIDYPQESQTLVNFETDDLEGVLERLRAEGVEVLHDRPVDCPVGIYGAIRDPAGNVLELIEYR